LSADRKFLEAGPGAMSLQRRLILYLIVCAPIIWTAALAASVSGGSSPGS